jgi:DNA-binding NarL/FixJ family response regulator
MPESTQQIRILLADDHLLFRDGLRKLLESEPGIEIVGEAADGVETIDVARRLEPDILLLDLAMPRLNGLESLATLDTTRTRVILLTAALNEAELLKAIQLGARGVVLKEEATRSLLDAIHRVIDGKYAIGPESVDNLVNAVRRLSDQGQAHRYGLTSREVSIVSAIAAGQTNKDIADQLGISLQTVKHHLTSIFNKTGVSSRLELALFAVHHRLVDDE